MNFGSPIGRLWTIGALALATPFLPVLAQDTQTVPETCADGPFKVLLIGNRAYQKLPPVETAINDLNSIKSAMQAILVKDPAFTTLEDVRDISELKTKIDRFTAEVRPGDVVLFYYTGHAIQYEDDDFLLPLNFDPKEDPETITSTAYSVSSRLIARLKNASARVVILDAGRQWNGPGGILGLRGLTASNERTAIFFSTAADATMPPTGPESPTSEFARQFIAAIKNPGLNISQLFEKIGNSVRAVTGGLQQPFSASSAGLSDCRLLKAPPPGPQTNVPRTNPRDNLEYVYIPPGNFIMGCADKDTRCSPEEKSAHHVNIGRGFWAGVNEVTVTEYLRYVKIAKAVRPKAPLKNPGWEHGDFPIVNVAWSDADKFCKWAGGRLPTEAEWEYAARGGSATIYPWGDEITHEDAKFNAVIRGNKIGADIYEEMAPVRQYRKNGWGLYDVVGNVWEWVNDWYMAPYDPDPPDGPRGPQTGDKKVVRGGSYHDSDNGVRLSVRKSASPKELSNEVGFRCVIDDWPK